MSTQTMETLTVGQLRAALTDLPDEADLWLDVDHDLIRRPVDQYAHTTMRATNVTTNPGSGMATSWPRAVGTSVTIEATEFEEDAS